MKARAVNAMRTLYVVVAVALCGAPALSAAAPAQAPLTKDSVAQKIRFVDMLTSESKLAYRLTHSDNDEAQQMLEDARELVSASRQALKSGDLSAAVKHADESLHLMRTAAQRLPEHSRTDLQLRYKERLDAVATFKDSYDRHFQRRTEEDGPDAVGEPLDVAAFERLVADAKAAAADARLGDANHLLATAQRRVTKALTVLLEGQTLVYDKDFETPREEYEYETARHKSYAELIPRAVEQRQPSTRAVELIDQFVGVSESMKSEAVDQASGGHYQDAIHTLQQATAQLQRALWVAGVRWARWSN